MSAVSSRIGAASRLRGRIQRWSGPTTVRSACGTMSPTKAIGPAAAVAAPHSSVTATTPANFVTPGREPRATAASSPSAVPVSTSFVGVPPAWPVVPMP